ncbi:hypothetical protein SAMN04488505_102663 [Chitinophaga rupis]|uniref:Methanolan biosynthesis EpsI domain-containing protein n=1 Tax=Chitinophaga rupis TaxID=573321 RepID=A0A1H7RKG2_9BACT|nr:hypothetical protein [Chitinophaga rupis]SEL60652.1 hypothetical protein SAMN04488505_102663 [Chitinophaga rupis]
MKRTLAITISFTGILFSALFQTTQAQTRARILSRHSTDSLFTPALQQQLEISYPIFRAYQYTDKGGTGYLLLMEKSETHGLDTTVTNLAAACIQQEQGGFKILWKMKDLLEPEESSIWFWSKYIQLQDLNGDGYIDPYVVYGSRSREEEGEYRRLKILLYNNGSKTAIRAVTGTLDEERSLQYDKSFSALPAAMQSYFKQLLQRISKETDYILAN